MAMYNELCVHPHWLAAEDSLIESYAEFSTTSSIREGSLVSTTQRDLKKVNSHRMIRKLTNGKRAVEIRATHGSIRSTSNS